MSGIQDNQVLDSSADAPISAFVYFALIAGVQPATSHHTCSYFGAVPVARKDVRATDKDLFVFTNLHLNARNCSPNIPPLYGHSRIIHGADPGGFREAVCLQYGNPQHPGKLLRL